MSNLIIHINNTDEPPQVTIAYLHRSPASSTLHECDHLWLKPNSPTNPILITTDIQDPHELILSKPPQDTPESPGLPLQTILTQPEPIRLSTYPATGSLLQATENLLGGKDHAVLPISNSATTSTMILRLLRTALSKVPLTLPARKRQELVSRLISYLPSPTTPLSLTASPQNFARPAFLKPSASSNVAITAPTTLHKISTTAGSGLTYRIPKEIIWRDLVSPEYKMNYPEPYYSHCPVLLYATSLDKKVIAVRASYHRTSRTPYSPHGKISILPTLNHSLITASGFESDVPNFARDYFLYLPVMTSRENVLHFLASNPDDLVASFYPTVVETPVPTYQFQSLQDALSQMGLPESTEVSTLPPHTQLFIQNNIPETPL